MRDYCLKTYIIIIFLLIYFCLCWVFLAVQGRGLPCPLLIMVASLVAERGLQASWFQKLQHEGPRAQ